MPKNRIIKFILLVVFLLWTGPFIAFYPIEDIDPDTAYHLGRVQKATHTYPRVDSYDLNSHFPSGNRTHWPNTYTVLLATIKLIAGQNGLSWIPVIAGVLCWFLIFRAIRQSNDSHWLSIVGFGYIFLAPEAYQSFIYGTLDHHWVSQLAFALMLPHVLGQSGKRLSIVGVTLALLGTPESLVLVSLYLGLRFFQRLVHSKDISNSVGYWELIGVPVIAFIVYCLHFCLDVNPLPFFSFSPRYQTLFQPLWFLSLGCLGHLGIYIFSWILNSQTRIRVSTKNIALGMACLAFVGLILYGLVHLEALSPFMERLAGSEERVLVNEEFSPLFYPTFQRSPNFYKLYLVIIVTLLWATVKKVIIPSFGIIVILLLILGLSEMRFLCMLCPVVPLALHPLTQWLFDSLKNTSLSLVPRGAIFALPFAVFYLFLTPISISQYLSRKNPRANKVHVLHELKKGRSRLDLNYAEGKGIAGPWSFGHHLNYWYGMGAVMDPFNFPTSISRPIRDLYHQKSIKEVRKSIEQYQVDYLLMVWGYQAFYDLRPPLKSDVKWANVLGRRIPIVNQEMQGFPLLRSIYDLNTLNFELGFEEVFSSKLRRPLPLSSEKGEIELKSVPLVQLFRKMKVAIIKGRLPEGDESLSVEYIIRHRGARESQKLVYPVECSPEGDFYLEASFCAPFQYEGFSVESGYRLTTLNFESIIEVPRNDENGPAQISAVWRKRHDKDSN